MIKFNIYCPGNREDGIPSLSDKITVSSESGDFGDMDDAIDFFEQVFEEFFYGCHVEFVPEAPKKHRPEVVCLCGSTRFYKEFQIANYELTMEGAIVLSVGFYPHSQEHHETVGIAGTECPESKKAELDELHLRKIDLADRVKVLNPGGYVGESTAREILYARRTGKPVSYMVDTLTGPGLAILNLEGEEK